MPSPDSTGQEACPIEPPAVNLIKSLDWQSSRSLSHGLPAKAKRQSIVHNFRLSFFLFSTLKTKLNEFVRRNEPGSPSPLQKVLPALYVAGNLRVALKKPM
jgi:hypothetical protein